MTVSREQKGMFHLLKLLFAFDSSVGKVSYRLYEACSQVPVVIDGKEHAPSMDFTQTGLLAAQRFFNSLILISKH